MRCVSAPVHMADAVIRDQIAALEAQKAKFPGKKHKNRRKNISRQIRDLRERLGGLGGADDGDDGDARPRKRQRQGTTPAATTAAPPPAG